MRAVDVRVGHDDDPVVADFLRIEVLGADPASKRGDHRLDLVAAEHLVEARLLDVEDLALERQDRLKAPIASLLRRSPCRLALDEVELAQRRIALLAVGQLAGQRAAVERALAAHEIAGLAGRLARTGGVDRLADDAPRHGRVLFEIGAETVVDDRLDNPLHLGVPQLGLRLAFELRVRDLDADDGGQPFADVLAADALFQVFREVVLRRVAVDGARQRRAEAGQMRAALVRVDVVREGVDRLRVAVVPLQRDLRLDPVLLPAHEDRLLVDRRFALVEVLDKRDDARPRSGTCGPCRRARRRA